MKNRRGKCPECGHKHKLYYDMTGVPHLDGTMGFDPDIISACHYCPSLWKWKRGVRPCYCRAEYWRKEAA